MEKPCRAAGSSANCNGVGNPPDKLPFVRYGFLYGRYEVSIPNKFDSNAIFNHGVYEKKKNDIPMKMTNRFGRYGLVISVKIVGISKKKFPPCSSCHWE